MPSRSTGTPRGYVIPIGGAEDKAGTRSIHRRFLKLAGGRDARLVIIPTASRLVDTGDRYRDLYEDLGARRIHIARIDERSDCDKPEHLEALEQATGIFMTGGNQLRLSTILGGTPIATAIRRRNAAGAHVAGTSAGAAYIPEHMIAFGQEGPRPVVGKVTLAPGLGLTNAVIVDQHFRQRNRLGRLLTSLAYNPFAHGIGLDEDTAAFIDADDQIEVMGSGGLTILDMSGLSHSSMPSADVGDVVQVIGVKLHILTDGAKYDLKNREAIPG